MVKQLIFGRLGKLVMKIRVKNQRELYAFLNGNEKDVLLTHVKDFFELADLSGPYEYEIPLDMMLSIIALLITSNSDHAKALGHYLRSKVNNNFKEKEKTKVPVSNQKS